MEKKKDTKLSIQHYRAADDLPAYNYFKVIETNDHRWLLKEWQDKEVDLFELWESITDTIIDEFGVSQQAQEVLRLQKSISLLTAELIINEKKEVLNRIRIKEKQLEQLTKATEEPQSHNKQARILSNYFKREINLKNISIVDYMYDLELFKETQKNG